MLLFRIVLATLVFSGLVYGRVASPKLSGSNGDQYREGGAGPGARHSQVEMPLFREKDATDKGLLSPPSNNGRSVEGEKVVVSPNRQHVKEKSKDMVINRNRRSYYPYATYTIQIPQYQGINVWRAPVYPLQRPYYVPVYGIDGRIPIYFPPQQVYLNPGTPPKNPAKPPYVGPTYLPPTTPPTPTKNGTTVMPTDNRFNDYDDRPIWDVANEVDMPGGPTTNRPSMIPTRKPEGQTSTFPPLVHKSEDGSRTNNVNHLSSNTESPRRPITTAPPTTQPPGPGRCVWAIVSCCSTSSKDVSENCFAQLGCPGPFWGDSPCETEFAKAAIQSALNYYNSRP